MVGTNKEIRDPFFQKYDPHVFKEVQEAETELFNTQVSAKQLGKAIVKITPAIQDEICERIAIGQSARKIAEDPTMPSIRAIFYLLRTDESFLQQYIRAKEEQAEYLIEELLDISDDAKNDWMQKNAADNPGWVINGEHIARSRLRIETRKWIAAKLKPIKYGDSIKVTHDHNSPVTLEALTPEQIKAYVISLVTMLDVSHIATLIEELKELMSNKRANSAKIINR